MDRAFLNGDAVLTRPVVQVIRCRNELMHSCEMRVSAQWMQRYQRSLEQLLQALQHVPDVATTRQHIQEVSTPVACSAL